MFSYEVTHRLVDTSIHCHRLSYPWNINEGSIVSERSIIASISFVKLPEHFVNHWQIRRKNLSTLWTSDHLSNDSNINKPYALRLFTADKFT